MVEYTGSPLVAILLWAALLLAVVAAFLHPREATRSQTALLLSAWVLTSYLVPYIRSITSTPCMLPRYTMVAVPAILVLASFGMTALGRRWAPVAGVLVIGLSVPPLLGYLERPAKRLPEDYRGIALQVARSRLEYPAFALKYTTGFFRFYLRHHGSGIEVYAARRLEQHLSLAPDSCFWLLDGHLPLMDTDIAKRLELKRHLRFRKPGVIALLLSSKTRAEPCLTEPRSRPLTR
jgi:hypothetical protein